VLNKGETVDAVFDALADPTRRRLVERLSCGPATVSELARPLPMSLPAVVQHLHLLEASGLVTSTKTGRVRTCRIAPEPLRTAERWIAERRASDESQDGLRAFLEKRKPKWLA
jgi:DNA-binding transcriptional ArsR family regulator